ncbi:MAG: hypothetical protein IT378_13500 [Sandaracinaceae bacterium]|nr:hypothetical protein [Sandaracinaceae bacterium]
MGRRLALVGLLGAGLLGALALSVPARATPGRPDPMRVLFVGNSYTRYNDLPGMVAEMSQSVPDGPLVVPTALTKLGATVRRHWIQRQARVRIERGDYDVLVLQGHSMAIHHAEEMRVYTERFAEQARRNGMRMVLFETWPRRDGHHVYRVGEAGTCPQDMLLEIDRLYGQLASCVGASLAPVGRAWMRELERHPDAQLHMDDGTHPSLEGTYLSALVLYGTLTGRDPRQVEFRHWRLTPPRARELRIVAADTLRTALR